MGSENFSTFQPNLEINYSQHRALIAGPAQLGTIAGRRFFEEFRTAAASSPLSPAQSLNRDPTPLLRAISQSVSTDLTPPAMVQIFQEIGLQPANPDWQVVDHWFSTIIAVSTDICAQTNQRRAQIDSLSQYKAKKFNWTKFYAGFEAKLAKIKSGFFDPAAEHSLSSPVDPTKWGISFSTRAALFAIAQFATSFVDPSAISFKRGEVAGVYAMVTENFGDWAVIFSANRPPLTAREIEARAQSVRFGVDQSQLPLSGYEPDIPTRSQTHRRGLPGRRSQQPDKPKR